MKSAAVRRLFVGLLLLGVMGLGPLLYAQESPDQETPGQSQALYLPWVQTGAGGTIPPLPTATPTPTPTSVPSPTPAPPVQYSYEVINRFPHDTGAFTQGLVYAREEERDLLYESTGLYGRSSLRRVDLTTGEVLQQRNLESRYFGEGLALRGDRLYQLTWRSGTGFIYDRATFEPVDEFSYSTEGWGLAEDGERLILSDGSSRLYFLDPESLGVTGQITVTSRGQPVTRLNELEVIDGLVWANVWLTDRVVIIDPAHGWVVGEVDFAGLLTPGEASPADVLNGIAYDPAGQRIFVTGKLWPWLFEVAVVPAGE
jgi:glutamine cyclotransferase